MSKWGMKHLVPVQVTSEHCASFQNLPPISRPQPAAAAAATRGRTRGSVLWQLSQRSEGWAMLCNGTQSLSFLYFCIYPLIKANQFNRRESIFSALHVSINEMLLETCCNLNEKRNKPFVSVSRDHQLELLGPYTALPAPRSAWLPFPVVRLYSKNPLKTIQLIWWNISLFQIYCSCGTVPVCESAYNTCMLPTCECYCFAFQ